ncbi:nucleotide exchange factor GrpE [Metabacillus indicus]|uniref:nucleotide exchange factor GrpE n=1 Tax=Metabacillus indicus TaxID=246786 RepID=UPI003170B8E4
MNDRKQIIQEFITLEKNYNDKKHELESWKRKFGNLEEGINHLISTFEKQYEQLSTEEFNEDIKNKLENRLEGIRLSVKSSNRLHRKLNLDKPFPQPSVMFIPAAEIIKKDHVGVPESNRKEFLEAHPSENLNEDVNKFTQQTPDSFEKLSVSNLKSEVHSQVDQEIIAEDVLLESSEEEKGERIQIPGNEELELSNVSLENERNPKDGLIEPEAVENEQPVRDSQHEKPIEVSISELESAVKSNQSVIEEMDECLAVIEKRFFGFVEKGIAPVFDGLFSGRSHAEKFTLELASSAHHQVGEVAEWLNIYSRLMNEIEGFLEMYQIEFYLPKTGILFDEMKHEPIGVVEDAEFKDEQIKEVVRCGIYYSEEYPEKKKLLLRPAQVIVVKNDR